MDKLQEIKARHKKIHVFGYKFDFFLFVGGSESDEKEWFRGQERPQVTSEDPDYEAEKARITAFVADRDNSRDNMVVYEQDECKYCQAIWPCDTAVVLGFFDEGIS